VRRAFQLPEPDEDFLRIIARPWETVLDGSTRWLLMHQWPIPVGYNHPAATAAVLIAEGYPDAQIDMVYFSPHLTRTDGRAIGALTGHQIDGQQWQRWSRHRTAENAWRPGIDDLSSHMILVDYWLSRELESRAA
jgi:hypothetical protein